MEMWSVMNERDDHVECPVSHTHYQFRFHHSHPSPEDIRQHQTTHIKRSQNTDSSWKHTTHIQTAMRHSPHQFTQTRMKWRVDIHITLLHSCSNNTTQLTMIFKHIREEHTIHVGMMWSTIQLMVLSHTTFLLVRLD